MPVAPLPIRDGLNPTRLILHPHHLETFSAPPTVLQYLLARFPDDAARLTQKVHDGEVRLQDGTVATADTLLFARMELWLYREPPEEPVVPFEYGIVYEDEDILVVDKPHFLSTIPRGSFIRQTLLVRLRVELDIPNLAPAHRLDRVTAGLVLFTKRRELRGAYQLLFQNRQVGKTYFAVAPVLPDLLGRGEPTAVKTRIIKQHGVAQASQVPGEPNSHSEIELLDHRGDLGLYRLRPITGKTHQLRLHMFHLGAPILQDNFYPEFIGRELTDYRFPLQLLSATLEFTDPLSGQERIFRSNRQLELWPDEIKY